MRILILSFYFRPDLSAGSFRATALVNALRQANPGVEIDVVTTLPNRYESFTVDAPQAEANDGIFVHRIALPRHKSGMVDQSIAFMTFSRQVLSHIASRNYDMVFATSSRLMTAVLGSWIARRKRTKLYLDFRDIFVDTIKDVLPKRIAFFTTPLFSLID